MNPQNEAFSTDVTPAPADTNPKLPWQTPLLEDLSIQDTAGPDGPYDGDDDSSSES